MKNQKTADKEQLNQSTDRLLKVMECMAKNRLPARLTDLAEELAMPQATLLRYLRTLCSQGYVYHDEQTNCYALTWRICKLSDSIKVSLSLRSMASPFLNSMANRLNASVCLVIPYENGTTYLDFIEKPCMGMNTLIRIGKNAPIHCTGSGKVILSSYTDRKIQEIVDKNGLERMTSHTITDPEQLLAELEKIRKHGFAYDNEECEEGVRCVSVPVFDYSGSVAAAISIVDETELMTQERIEKQILPELRGAAHDISYRLGYEGV